MMNEINIIIAGDFCPNNRAVDLIEKGLYVELFGPIKSTIEKADYAIVNLEAPIMTEKGMPIVKWGPNLKCSKKVIDAIIYSGFKCTTLANNHFYDYGEEGAMTTLNTLENNNIDFVGAGENLQCASKTLIKNIKGKKIAFINCCEHEYSIATEEHAGSNPLNPIRQYYSIREAAANCDYVIAIVHGGIEGYQLPTPRMQEVYHFFIDAGADIVVNHHQHCYSGYEIYRGKYIVYGLGNFCFDWEGRRNSLWNEGYIASLTCNEKGIEFEPLPYTQCDENCSVELIKGEEMDKFGESIANLNNIISDERLLSQCHKDYAHQTRLVYDELNPYSNRILRSLYIRGFLPSFFNRKKLLSIQNKLMCESHYERFLLAINEKLKS